MNEKNNQNKALNINSEEFDYYKYLLKQVELLAKWNKKNINNEPEQVRKNIETISNVVKF